MNADDLISGEIPVATTKADEIRHQLEELIMTGRLAPGTVLRQDELARRFEVSRTPVREALRQLAALGLASFIPNKGVRVRTLDRNDWTQTYLARASLEGTVTEIAASRITDDQLAQLAAADDEFVLETGRLRSADLSDEDRTSASWTWLKANDRFHDVIIDAANSPIIGDLIEGLRRMFSGSNPWSPGSATDDLYETTVRQHAAIRAALVARNGVAARALMEAHVTDSWRLLQAVLDEPQPRSAPTFSTFYLPARA